jgi:hypothetical protein
MKISEGDTVLLRGEVTRLKNEDGTITSSLMEWFPSATRCEQANDPAAAAPE